MKIKVPLAGWKYFEWDPDIGRDSIAGPGMDYIRISIDLLIEKGGIRERLIEVPFKKSPWTHIPDMALVLHRLQEDIPADWAPPVLPAITEDERQVTDAGGYI